METILKPNIERLEHDIHKLASFIDHNKKGWTRRPFTYWYKEAREWLISEMRDAGLEVTVDATANIIGRRPGANPELPSIMVGSHIDTVEGGGRFDGIIGVLAGLEIARRLKETDTTIDHPLEIVDFTAEEPSPFGISTIGSKGMVNRLTNEMLDRTDSDGVKLKDAIKQAGGDPHNLANSARKEDVGLYLEMHIEQGPILEHHGDHLGVVTGITGIQRCRVEIDGQPEHAGTTPMEMRKDALAAASLLVTSLETKCLNQQDAVGTVGKLNVYPNASNVVPGKVEFEFEVRSQNDTLASSIIDELYHEANEIGNDRALKVSIDLMSATEAVLVNDDVKNIISKACQSTAETREIVSGAGHDANQLASIAPVGMIFVPSKEGKSHCPEEWTSLEDVALGVEALSRSVLSFDKLLIK